MAGSIFGKYFRISTWGESHGKAIGVAVDGCPAGLPLTEADIQQYLNRRKPGQSRYTTSRTEADQVEISRLPGRRTLLGPGDHRTGGGGSHCRKAFKGAGDQPHCLCLLYWPCEDRPGAFFGGSHLGKCILYA